MTKSERIAAAKEYATSAMMSLVMIGYGGGTNFENECIANARAKMRAGAKMLERL